MATRTTTTRRGFLGAAAAGGAAVGLGDLRFLAALPPVRADEAQANPKIVQLRAEIEPIVRLLEETPREKLLETVAGRIRDGLNYRQVVTALQLAGVRNVRPRPSVGFKFHSVLVVNSAHLASMSSPDEHRWLPIFWALDYFKETQAEDAREGDWTMPPVDEAAVPPPEKAAAAYLDAMNRWDESAADVAAAGLARSTGGQRAFEMLFRLGARDFRDIGHKAIFVANSFRTLQCMGWRHAEPVLRSLAFALTNHRDDPNPAKSDLAADRPWKRNLELAETLRKDWMHGKTDDGATKELLATLRGGSPDDAATLAVKQINAGVNPQSVWDAALLGGGELLFRQRGIVALHSLTTGNALHFAYQTAGDDSTRRMAMLQCLAFVPMFRDAMTRRGRIRDFKIDALEPHDLETSDRVKLVDEVFTEVSRDRDTAAAKTLAAVRSNDVAAKQIIDAGRVLVFLKGNNSHDYKFSSAVLEDYRHVSPAWRDRFLAAGVFNLRGALDRDNPLVKRTRAALGAKGA